MIVQLTTRQLDRVQDVVQRRGDDDPLLTWLGRGATQVSDRKWGVWMPAIGWLHIERAMFNHCYDDHGYRGRRVRESDLRALRIIRAAVNVREHHPALFKMGAVGTITEIVPAWRLLAPKEAQAYSPYPVMAAPFVALVPTHERGLTHWSEGTRPTEMPLLDEREHLALVS